MIYAAIKHRRLFGFKRTITRRERDGGEASFDCVPVEYISHGRLVLRGGFSIPIGGVYLSAARKMKIPVRG